MRYELTCTWTAFLCAFLVFLTACAPSGDDGSSDDAAPADDDSASDDMAGDDAADDTAGDDTAGDDDTYPPDSILPPPPEGSHWELVWNDEFDGDALDASKWTASDGPRRDGYWTPDAVHLDGAGLCVFDIYEDSGVYYDGAIDTMNKYDRAFGYFETRIWLHTQGGHWPAFWMMPYDFGEIGNGGVDGVEIDIMEKPWTHGPLKNMVNHAFHWDGYGEGGGVDSKLSNVAGILEGFHTYGLWWTPDAYILYIDGVERWRTTGGGVCQDPLYLVLSDEIGNLFFGMENIGDATLPDHWFVDFVRVYDSVTPDL